jgi:hypothetical protein
MNVILDRIHSTTHNCLHNNYAAHTCYLQAAAPPPPPPHHFPTPKPSRVTRLPCINGDLGTSVQIYEHRHHTRERAGDRWYLMTRIKAVTEIPLRFYSFHIRFLSGRWVSQDSVSTDDTDTDPTRKASSGAAFGGWPTGEGGGGGVGAYGCQQVEHARCAPLRVPAPDHTIH